MGNLEWVDGPPDGSRRRSIDRTGPVLIAAFEGWNDAGDAATSAVEHLWEHWGATTVAAIDPEDFYDFTATRPQVRRDPHGRRVLEWPANELGWAEPAGTDGVVLLAESSLNCGGGPSARPCSGPLAIWTAAGS